MYQNPQTTIYKQLQNIIYFFLHLQNTNKVEKVWGLL